MSACPPARPLACLCVRNRSHKIAFNRTTVLFYSRLRRNFAKRHAMGTDVLRQSTRRCRGRCRCRCCSTSADRDARFATCDLNLASCDLRFAAATAMASFDSNIGALVRKGRLIVADTNMSGVSSSVYQFLSKIRAQPLARVPAGTFGDDK